MFYTHVAVNDFDEYRRETLDGQMKSELLMALAPAFAQLSAQRIDYTEIMAHTFELAEALNEVLSKKWRDLRGIEIVSFGISNIKANEEDEAKIQKAQMGMTFGRDPRMALGAMVDSTTDSMRMAAGNQNAGAAFGFMGMNMAGNAGAGMFQTLAGQAAQQPAPQPSAPFPAPQAANPNGWDCSCGQKGNTGKFCMACGAKKPEPAGTWDCACGHKGNTGKFCGECGAPKSEAQPQGWTCPGCGTVNQGKFCMNCGAQKPEDAPLYRCDKCGWQPPDPHHPPKFCPQCGDPFDDSDKT